MAVRRRRGLADRRFAAPGASGVGGDAHEFVGVVQSGEAGSGGWKSATAAERNLQTEPTSRSSYELKLRS